MRVKSANYPADADGGPLPRPRRILIRTGAAPPGGHADLTGDFAWGRNSCGGGPPPSAYPCGSFCRYVGAVNDAELWLLRLMWLIMPFAAGPVFSAGLDESRRRFQVGAWIGLWVIWALLLIALMVPRVESLTALRVVVPAALVALVIVALRADEVGAGQLVAVGVVTAAASAIAMRATIADRFVDGSSHGAERRFLLRTPGPLIVGPLALVWVAVVVGAVGGPLLLLDGRWTLGAPATVVGWAAAWIGIRAIHRLSTRWLVFVPAGVVVHDKTALREPQLFPSEDVAAFGPAPIDTMEEDLSLNAPGLALRVALKEPSKIVRNSRTNTVELTDITGFVVTPNRPGAVIDEARARNFPIA